MLYVHVHVYSYRRWNNAKSTRNPRKTDIFTYFPGFWGYFLDFLSNITAQVNKICFFSFSNKNHAESSIDFVKIPFLDPKRAKLDQNSDFGHVRTCPGGQVLTANQRRYLFFLQILHLSFFSNKFKIFDKIMCFSR